MKTISLNQNDSLYFVYYCKSKLFLEETGLIQKSS